MNFHIGCVLLLVVVLAAGDLLGLRALLAGRAEHAPLGTSSWKSIIVPYLLPTDEHEGS